MTTLGRNRQICYSVASADFVKTLNTVYGQFSVLNAALHLCNNASTDVEELQDSTKKDGPMQDVDKERVAAQKDAE